MRNLHYSWVMVLISMCVLAIMALTIYIFGVFFKPLTTEFNWDRGALSGAYSMYVLLTGIFSILTGRLSDKYGPRILVTLYGLLSAIGFLLMSQISSLWQVYLIWGLFMGIGGSCCLVPIISTIPRWFAKRAGMAASLHFLASRKTSFILEYGVEETPIRWDVTKQKMKIDSEGYVHVPEDPGLGIDLNEATIEKLRVK